MDQPDHEPAVKKLLERRRKIDSALSDVLGDMTAEQRFSLYTDVNKRKALEDRADFEDIAERCLIATRDIYEHYEIGEEYETFPEFVADLSFEDDELDAFLESREE
jgi:hypothetical protein